MQELEDQVELVSETSELHDKDEEEDTTCLERTRCDSSIRYSNIQSNSVTGLNPLCLEVQCITSSLTILRGRAFKYTTRPNIVKFISYIKYE